MAENTKIEWATHSWNPWRGCTKVSAGCQNCYADTLSKRNPATLGIWGPNGTRVVAAEAAWKEPLKWNRKAAWCGNPVCKAAAMGRADGRCACGLAVERPRVFCASLADVFEDWRGPMINAAGVKLWKAWHADTVIASEERPKPRFAPLRMEDVRGRLFDLIDATPNLDWLLVTKRPENIARMMPPVRCTRCFGGPCDANCPERGRVRPNLWLITSVENQETANRRIPELLKVPAVVRGLSCEPLLGPVDLGGPTWEGRAQGLEAVGIPHRLAGEVAGTFKPLDGLHWVIVGGESGPRPMHPEWAKSLRDQCVSAGVPFFFKQWGDFLHVHPAEIDPTRRLVGIDDAGQRCEIGRHGAIVVQQLGKKLTGRLLDGREWNEFPVPHARAA